MDKLDNVSTDWSVKIEIPNRVYFSRNPKDFKVENDFYFKIYGTGEVNDTKESEKSAELDGGEIAPMTIYIDGFEKLFVNSQHSESQRNETLVNFLKKLHPEGDSRWDIKWGKIPKTEKYCVVISCGKKPANLSPDFSVTFALSSSQEVAFGEPPVEVGVPLKFGVTAVGFNVDVEPSELVLGWEYVEYLEGFGAYVAGGSKEERIPVTSVRKGEKCDISWSITDNARASTLLYDKNGAIVANLPPYTATIEEDSKFTLRVYTNSCSITRSIVVYRTLWEKNKVKVSGFPDLDDKGRFKLYQDYNGGCYLYVHPKLYRGTKIGTANERWSVVSTNTTAPVATDYHFYSSASSHSRFSVCYLSNTLNHELTYCEFDFNSKVWSKVEIAHPGSNEAYAVHDNADDTHILVRSGDYVIYYELFGASLVNAEYLSVPAGAELKAVDIFNSDGRVYAAVLTKNKRVYFYDFEDEFRNNIFECPDESGDYVYLVKSNALYVVVSRHVFEVSDRQKFTDIHFFPEHKSGFRPAIGGLDNETIAGFFKKDGETALWKYKF